MDSVSIMAAFEKPALLKQAASWLSVLRQTEWRSKRAFAFRIRNVKPQLKTPLQVLRNTTATTVWIQDLKPLMILVIVRVVDREVAS